MKLVYKIDQKYDERMIFEFMPKEGMKNKERFSDLMRIDEEDLAMLLQKKTSNTNKTVDILVKEKYKKILPYLKNSANDYQKSWNKINNKFFAEVEKKTGHSWKHKKYFCVVSAYHEGISSWGGNTIARRWSINADTQRPVTAHELALSHFWSILAKNKISKKWSDDKIWKYSEIFSWCLLGLDENFYKFWPWQLKMHAFPQNHNYPEIIPLQIKMRDLYFQCKNFKEFLDKAIK